MKVLIRYNGDDWLEIFKDEELIFSGHSLRVIDVVRLLEDVQGYTEVEYHENVDFD